MQNGVIDYSVKVLPNINFLKLAPGVTQALSSVYTEYVDCLFNNLHKVYGF